MIAEMIMSHYAWEVWMPNTGQRRPPWALFADGFHVGTWTGPDGDLLCVRKCETAEEAERWLSPPAPTILLACLRALWRRKTLP
jgi:hypothetical protein